MLHIFYYNAVFFAASRNSQSPSPPLPSLHPSSTHILCTFAVSFFYFFSLDLFQRFVSSPPPYYCVPCVVVTHTPSHSVFNQKTPILPPPPSSSLSLPPSHRCHFLRRLRPMGLLLCELYSPPSPPSSPSPHIRFRLSPLPTLSLSLSSPSPKENTPRPTSLDSSLSFAFAVRHLVYTLS